MLSQLIKLSVLLPFIIKVSPDELLRDRGEYRNIAIHLMKKWTSITNRQIGGLFGDLSYTAVSKANTRFIMKMNKDRKLRKRVDDVLENMSKVKGSPLLERSMSDASAGIRPRRFCTLNYILLGM